MQKLQMNIYIELEVLRRELEGRLLVGLNLKLKKHRVFLGSRESIFDAALKKKISPGVIFMKDTNSTKEYIKIYKDIIKLGFKIVSQDEEGGYIDDSFNLYSKLRHLDGESFNYIEKYFCWGKRDKDYLEKHFSNKCKYIITGSPRIELCKPSMKMSNEKFAENYNLKKKYIFFTIQTPILFARSFPERMKLKLVNLLDDENRNEINEKKYEDECIGILVLNKFIELILFLLKNLIDYDIIVRIHPSADEKNFLDLISFDHPRLRIISDGFMSEFINHSEIVIQNSCTGALEAFIAEKPVISFIPKIKINATEKMDNFPNRIGVKLTDSKEILNFIKTPIRNFSESEEIKNRIYTDKSSHELIAENINNIEINSKSSSAKFNYTFKKSYIYLILKNNLKKIFSKYFNYKFTDNSSRYIKFYRDFNFENLSTVLNNIKKKRINSDYNSCEIKMINDSIFEIKKKN
tara:strand:- start:117 stop:1508 length:1392 start_codon:yes stop_codon:yes gene_type:complete